MLASWGQNFFFYIGKSKTFPFSSKSSYMYILNWLVDFRYRHTIGIAWIISVDCQSLWKNVFQVFLMKLFPSIMNQKNAVGTDANHWKYCISWCSTLRTWCSMRMMNLSSQTLCFLVNSAPEYTSLKSSNSNEKW